jgi:hypothetical protein
MGDLEEGRMKRKALRKGGRTSAGPTWENDQERSAVALLAEFEREFLASAERLRAAGLIETIDHDPATGTGVVTFTEDGHQLMLAGRNVYDEPGFLRAWMTGDPDQVRQWVESEAALLRGETRTPIETNETHSRAHRRSRT